MPLATVRRRLRTFSVAVLVAAAGLPAGTSAQDAAGASVRVRTIAGSGAAGTADGAAASASFEMPSGVAFDPQGNVYIADAAAGNIRKLDAAGSVRTVAGPAAPAPNDESDRAGYRDGPAQTARFNHPAGLAVGPDGALYVADRQNDCVRVVKNGMVTTFAGDPAHPGHLDGPRRDASFSQPVALATDANGILFVADAGGVREIALDGTVSSIAVDLRGRARGLSIGTASGGTSLFVSDAQGLVIFDVATGKTTRYDSAVDPVHLSTLQGNVDLGFPFALAALSDHEVLYTDLRTNAVHYLNGNYTRIVAGGAGYDPSNTAGGYSDGSGPAARFFAPEGIGVSRTGRIVVADAGNRRIRELSMPDRRYYVTASLQNSDQYPVRGGDEAIAYVGNSLSWTDSTWPQSIAARIERDLGASARWHAAHRGRPVVVPYALPGASLAATIDFVEAVPSEGPARTVVLQLNSAYVSDYGARSPHELAADTSWARSFGDGLRGLRESLQRKNVSLLIAYGPYGYELEPFESAEWQYDAAQPYWQIAADASVVHERAIAAIRAAGCVLVDAWPAFIERENASRHEPLFGAVDPHLTSAGRALFGDVVAGALIDSTKAP